MCSDFTEPFGACPLEVSMFRRRRGHWSFSSSTGRASPPPESSSSCSSMPSSSIEAAKMNCWRTTNASGSRCRISSAGSAELASICTSAVIAAASDAWSSAERRIQKGFTARRSMVTTFARSPPGPSRVRSEAPLASHSNRVQSSPGDPAGVPRSRRPPLSAICLIRIPPPRANRETDTSPATSKYSSRVSHCTGTLHAALLMRISMSCAATAEGASLSWLLPGVLVAAPACALCW
mmetsp:Transcript_89277/g.261012  ORF Transcript_89277/g.261012 Transcript_89277/m.261012 type:complete len:236 (+) Transcript_89277:55-762(+)